MIIYDNLLVVLEMVDCFTHIIQYDSHVDSLELVEGCEGVILRHLPGL